MEFSAILGLAVGALLLWGGGEALVAGSAAVARRAGLSPVLTGVVLLGFGTSIPELVTSVDATLAGAPAIAIGNVVGSNTANILLILGAAALISPIRIDRSLMQFDAWVMVWAAIFMGAVLFRGLDRMDGALMLLMLATYLLVAIVVQFERTPAVANHAAPATLVEPVVAETASVLALWQSLALVVLGIAGVVGGASLFVDGAVSLASTLGVSQPVIGASIVAVGTSLPELSASIVAAFRRQAELSIGNVLGSNIFNVFGVLGASAMTAPLVAESEVLTRDLPVMLGATALILLIILTKPAIGRLAGCGMLVAYALYIAVLAG